MKYFNLFIVLLMFSCATNKGLQREDTLVKDVDFSWDSIKSDYKQDFCHGLYQQSLYLKRKKKKVLSFGRDKISAEDYALSLKKMYEVCLQTPMDFHDFIKNHFEVYRVVGDNKQKSVLLTSYFEPIIKGSRDAVYPYTMPLYGVPYDLVEVSLAKQKFYGRLEKYKQSGIERRKVVEYLKRHEIDKKVLKNAEIFAWVDPIEGFFMQIQGSGQVHISDQINEKIRLGYASQNGHPFYPIGKSLLSVIPLKKMSMDAIKVHLRSLSNQKALDIMHKDSSYVFFEKLQGRPKTSNGTEVIDGHTIATDDKFFDKGIVGLLKFKDPDKKGKKIHRFILNQDRGGAIQGPNRVDLFWGTGKEAGHKAGSILQKDAKLMYLKPKKSSLLLWKSSMGSVHKDGQKDIQIRNVGV